MASRRGFIAGASSLLIAPLLNVQPSVDRHELLMMFTDKVFMRFDLSRPYFLSGHAYASCGRTMARIASSETETLDESIKIPPMERVWSDHYKPTTRWQKFELYDIADLKRHPKHDACATCPECDNRWIPIPSSWLDDHGYLLPERWDERGVDHETGEMRDRSCKLCHGEDWRGGWLQPIGDRSIAYEYAKKLARVPGCEVALAPPVVAREDYVVESVLFRSDLISGIVCCISED